MNMWNLLTRKKKQQESNEIVVDESPRYQIEYFKSNKNNKWYFRVRSLYFTKNIVASSRQAYSNKQDMLDVLDSLKLYLGTSKIVDKTK